MVLREETLESFWIEVVETIAVLVLMPPSLYIVVVETLMMVKIHYYILNVDLPVNHDHKPRELFLPYCCFL